MMPNTRLQIASAEFLGGGALPGSGGMILFIGLIGFGWFGFALPDHYNDPLRNFNDFPHLSNQADLPGRFYFFSFGLPGGTPVEVWQTTAKVPRHQRLLCDQLAQKKTVPANLLC
jgi:hypothetical protein